MLTSLREWRARSAAQAALRRDLKDRMGALLALGPEDGVTVNEIACADPGCPDVETVFLLMRAGEETRAAKSPKAMADLTEIDLEVASAILRRPA